MDPDEEEEYEDDEDYGEAADNSPAQTQLQLQATAHLTTISDKLKQAAEKRLSDQRQSHISSKQEQQNSSESSFKPIQDQEDEEFSEVISTKTKTTAPTVAEDIDPDAVKLDANDCEFFVDGDDIKILESNYFARVIVSNQLLFGGTLGKSDGGTTAFTISANGKLLVQAVNTGSILVYETE